MISLQLNRRRRRPAGRGLERRPIRKGGKLSSSVGERLVFDFAEQRLADELDRVQQIFSYRGAYRRFKDLLDHKGLLQSWYDFENQREEEALREWALDNKIELKTS